MLFISVYKPVLIFGEVKLMDILEICILLLLLWRVSPQSLDPPIPNCVFLVFALLCKFAAEAAEDREVNWEWIRNHWCFSNTVDKFLSCDSGSEDTSPKFYHSRLNLESWTIKYSCCRSRSDFYGSFLGFS